MDEDTGYARLAERIRGGDSDAEAVIYNRFWKGLVAMLNQRTRDLHLAQDLAQDTLIIVLGKLRDGHVENPEALAGYVHQTAKYVHVGWLRKKGNMPHDEVDGHHLTDLSDHPSQARGREEIRVSVQRLLDALPQARDREILTRYYLHDELKENTCDVLELSSAHFDRVLSRAKQRLRKIVESEGHDWSFIFED